MGTLAPGGSIPIVNLVLLRASAQQWAHENHSRSRRSGLGLSHYMAAGAPVKPLPVLQLASDAECCKIVLKWKELNPTDVGRGKGPRVWKWDEPCLFS